MKKVFLAILLLAVFTLAACNSNDDSSGNVQTTTQPATTTIATTQTSQQETSVAQTTPVQDEEPTAAPMPLDDIPNPYNNFEWRSREPQHVNVSIDRYHGDSVDIVFPSEIGGRKVAGFRMGAFQNAPFRSVVLPYYLESIVDLAFNGSALESITFGSYVTTIGNSSFAGCLNLTSVTIPGNIGIIGTFAFGDSTALAEVTLEYGIRTINPRAFENTAISHIDIPDSVGNVREGAFRYIEGLTATRRGNTYTATQINGVWDLPEEFYGVRR